MKTIGIILVFALGLIVSAFGQKATMELTFTADNNGQYVPLDSIFIENLTQGGDTTLYAPDTVLVLDYISSIGDNEAIGGNTFSVSQNYPNPFKGKTEVSLYLPGKESIKIIVRDILGRELAHYENNLSSGNHSFTFSAGNDKYYLLTVTGEQMSKTIKMLNANNNITSGGKCKIVYDKYENNMIGFKSQRLRRVAPALAEKAINVFVFNIGDELKYTAYSIFGDTSITDSPTGNQTYTFQYAVGVPCPGIPTVTDIDGNIYNTTQIGDQCWMKENLKTTTYMNGTPIPNVIDTNSWISLFSGAYVWYDHDISWKDLYGALYNWYAVDDANGLCPTGWHVPTDNEWTVLTDFIGGTGSPHGNELKSCRSVYSPLGEGCNTFEHPRWDSNGNNWGTDDYGFSAVPAGSRNSSFGSFSNLTYQGNWWSSSEDGRLNPWVRGLTYYFGNIDVGHSFKRTGYSVRCIRD